MIKLYKPGRDGRLEYHEAWTTDDGILEHWGVVGEVGEHRDHPRDAALGETADLERVLASARAAGFAELALADHRVLVLEYDTGGEDADEWLEMGEALEVELAEFLGWTGLGDCAGVALDDGVLEVDCQVVDFEAAAAAIAREVRGTAFGDYRRLYERQ